MPTYKTLIQKTQTLNSVYPITDLQPKAVITQGNFYHDRLNHTHGAVYTSVRDAAVARLNEKLEKRIKKLEKFKRALKPAEKLKLETAKADCDKNKAVTDLTHSRINDSVNFAVADVVFVVSTQAKTLAIRFPIADEKSIFNYANLPAEHGLLKKYCTSAQTNSERILTEKNLAIEGKNGKIDYTACNDSYFPQVAYHTEKYFFYHLLNKGLEKVVGQFASKSMTPEYIASINHVEIRMHSTRDMCRTCESVTISEKERLKNVLNDLLKKQGHAELANDFTCNFSMSYNVKERAGKTPIDRVGLKSKALLLSNPILHLKLPASRSQDYTVFTSGGESKALQDQKARALHLQGLTSRQAQDTAAWDKVEPPAAIEIQRHYRGFATRLKLEVQAKAAIKIQKHYRGHATRLKSMRRV